MSGDLVAAVDCGTTTVKAGVFDGRGRLLAIAARDCACARGKNGQVEVVPDRLMAAVFACLREAAGGLGPGQRGRICALAATNQRATVICADRAGRPVGRGISWLDARGGDDLRLLGRRLGAGEFHRITGLPFDQVFTLAKLLWIRRCRPDIYARTAVFMLVHDFVLGRLGCREAVTDWSNASLTGLFDVRRLRWSERIMDAARLDIRKFPAPVAPGSAAGRLSADAARQTGLREGILLVAGGGDQQCGGLGAGAVRRGVVEITLGTAGVPLCFSGRVVSDPRMRIMCCAHAAPGRWSLEGLQKSAGASLAWVAQITGAGDPLEPGFSRAAAGVEPGAGGVLFYPYLDGPSAPHWYAGATGMLVGLASSHRAPELLRAVMEGVALETRETLAVFAALGAPARDVRLTGGYTRVRVWNQIYADVLGRPVSTLAVPQATLLGAAMLAACGAGMHRSAPAAARAMVRLRETLAPDPESAGRYDAVFRRHREVGRMVHEAGVFGRIRGRD